MDQLLDPKFYPVFVVMLFPGLISMRFYRVLMPARVMDWQESLVESLFYSTVNFALCLPLLAMLHVGERAGGHPVMQAMGWIFVLAIAPLIWPGIWTAVVRSKWFRHRLQIPYPTAWDGFFDRRRSVFVLIHLNSGTKIGGYFGPSSYAGSFPNDGDIYIEKVVRLCDNTHEFGPYVENSAGMLIRRDQYQFIELFDIPTDTTIDQSKEQHDGRVRPEQGAIGLGGSTKGLHAAPSASTGNSAPA
ncbi:MAG: DUF6338 family protein [Phycisphaeraceae bacterium]